MNKNLVSIVVPVYNSAEHIERCVESVIDQSYDNWELILVNDGSTDDSLVVCYALQQRDKRITVVDKTNGGASSARNVGIDRATGHFLCFIDSDDYVGSHYLSDMVEAYIPDSFSLVITGMKLLCNGQFQTFNYQNETVTTNIISDLSLKKFYQHGGPTNKLYITKVVKDNAIRFDTSIRNYEDLIFNLNYLSHMKAIIYSESTEYVYDIGNSSASKTYNGVEGEMKLYSFYSEALEMFDLTLLNDRKIIDYKNAFVVRSLKSLYFPGCEQKSFCEKYNYLKILSDRVTPHFSYGESLLWKSMLRLLRYRLLLLTHICCACLGGIKKAKLE